MAGGSGRGGGEAGKVEFVPDELDKGGGGDASLGGEDVGE